MQNKSIKIDVILAKIGITELNKMQKVAIKALVKNDDVVLIAPTGSGKTLAFLLPTLQKLNPQIKKVQTLILAPTRELALQIEQVFKSMKTGYKVSCCYGGHPLSVEEKSLKGEAPAVLIGTPGRIVDHLNRENFETDALHTIVFDEFDKALELGFHDQMSYIVRHAKPLKQRVLISATDAIDIPSFVGISSPTRLNFMTASKLPFGLTLRTVYSPTADKLETLLDLISHVGDESALVFCNHRSATERISKHLTKKHIVHDFFHGGLDQKDRERVLSKFRNQSNKLLITTDLASRGLDIPEIKYIIHYHTPIKEDAFIHRNGRTARVDATGRAFLIFCEGEELPPFLEELPKEIKPRKNQEYPPEPEWISLSFNLGKKDKVNKIDIVGFLSKKGKLSREELGLIEVKDRLSYAAVKRTKVQALLNLIRNEKIKNKRVKIELA